MHVSSNRTSNYQYMKPNWSNYKENLARSQLQPEISTPFSQKWREQADKKYKDAKGLKILSVNLIWLVFTEHSTQHSFQAHMNHLPREMILCAVKQVSINFKWLKSCHVCSLTTEKLNQKSTSEKHLNIGKLVYIPLNNQQVQWRNLKQNQQGFLNWTKIKPQISTFVRCSPITI